MPTLATFEYDGGDTYSHSLALAFTDEEYKDILKMKSLPHLELVYGQGNDTVDDEVSLSETRTISQTAYDEVAPVINWTPCAIKYLSVLRDQIRFQRSTQVDDLIVLDFNSTSDLDTLQDLGVVGKVVQVQRPKMEKIDYTHDSEGTLVPFTPLPSALFKKFDYQGFVGLDHELILFNHHSYHISGLDIFQIRLTFDNYVRTNRTDKIFIVLDGNKVPILDMETYRYVSSVGQSVAEPEEF